jgi:hypothetical protein
VFSIRHANLNDVPTLLALIQEMADYERLSLLITEQTLTSDGFGSPPRFRTRPSGAEACSWKTSSYDPSFARTKSAGRYCRMSQRLPNQKTALELCCTCWTGTKWRFSFTKRWMPLSWRIGKPSA